MEPVNGDIRGNIDGEHTLRAIFKAQEDGSLSEDRCVFIEIFSIEMINPNTLPTLIM
jgi:hypothetical protein